MSSSAGAAGSAVGLSGVGLLAGCENTTTPIGLELGTPVMLYLPPGALRVLRPDPEPEVQSEDGETTAASVAE